MSVLCRRENQLWEAGRKDRQGQWASADIEKTAAKQNVYTAQIKSDENVQTVCTAWKSPWDVQTAQTVKFLTRNLDNPVKPKT